MSVSGIASTILSAINSEEGIDVESLVEEIIYSESATERLMEDKQDTLNTQVSAYQYINEYLDTLKDALASLQDVSGSFNAKTASSSNSSVLTATATTSATVASHTITVSSLATTSTYYSAQLASGTTTFATGTFTLQVGTGAAETITVDETNNTLDALVTHLNNDFEAQTAIGTLTLSGNAAAGETVTIGSTTYTFKTELSGANDVLVGATGAETLANLKAAINHDTGEGTTYGTGTVANAEATATASTDTTLTLEAQAEGAEENNITTTATLTNGAFGAGTLEDGRDDLGITASVITDAGGARLALVSETSGAPGDLTISDNTTGLSFTKGVTGTNASLTVDGVPISSASNTVSGVISGVTLKLVGTSTSQVSLSVGTDSTTARSAIDDFVSAYNGLIEAINSQFNYDSTDDTVGILAGDASLRIVQEKVLSAVAQSLSSNGTYTTLGSIGIDINNDGTLTVNDSELNAALEDNFSEVLNLFQNDSHSGLAQTFYTTLRDLTDSTTGPLCLAIKSANDTLSGLEDSIADFEARMEVRREELTDKYSEVNATLLQLPSLMDQIDSLLSSLS